MSFRFAHISDVDQISGDLEIKGTVVTGFESRSWAPSAPQEGKCKLQAGRACMDSLFLAKYPFIPLFQNNALTVLLQEVCVPR